MKLLRIGPVGAERPAVLDHAGLLRGVSADDGYDVGTPRAVGMGLAQPRFLRAGDQRRLTIDGLGEQRQRFVQATA